MDRKGRAQEKALCTEEAVQVLQGSYVQAGGQGAKRTWQDLYYLSEVPGAVRETQLVHRIISNQPYDLPDFPSAALYSIDVATATPHSPALQMKIHSASYSQKLIFRCTGTSIYIPVHKSMEKRNVWIYNCQ